MSLTQLNININDMLYEQITLCATHANIQA